MNYKSYSTKNPQKSGFNDPSILLFLNYILILLSLLIFISSATGYIGELTDGYKNFLLNNLGKTNKWSGSYGPEWFVGIAENISSVASAPILLIFVILISVYLYLKRDNKRLLIFLAVVLGGGLFEIILKLFFSEGPAGRVFDILIDNDNSFPSGHAAMSVIFYFTAAYLVSKSFNKELNLFIKRKINFHLLISVIILVILIGFSRVFTGAHTPNEVIAGWSVGGFWLSACWLIIHFFGISLND